MPRLAKIVAPATLVLAALVAVFAALAFGGGADPLLLVDPGEVVRYGLPVSKLLVNLAGAGSVGALILVLFALDSAKPEFGRALDVAAASAAVWTVASGATGFFTFLLVYNQPIRIDDTFGQVLGLFLTSTELG